MMTKLSKAAPTLAALAAPLLWCTPGSTQTAAAVRVGDHPGFGRVVFDIPETAGYDLVTEGERLLVVFHGAGTVPQPMTLPRNVLSIQSGSETATLLLAPGARTHAVRMSGRLVIDVLDPGRRAPPSGEPLPINPSAS